MVLLVHRGGPIVTMDQDPITTVALVGVMNALAMLGCPGKIHLRFLWMTSQGVQEYFNQCVSV